MLPFEASLSGTLTLHALIELGNIAFIKAHSGAGKVITASVQIVLDWHAALNARDVERLASLSAANVEVGGPRGVGNGIDLLRDWMERAGVRMAPVKWQAQGGSGGGAGKRAMAGNGRAVDRATRGGIGVSGE